jgi:hypothetical protein
MEDRREIHDHIEQALRISDLCKQAITACLDDGSADRDLVRLLTRTAAVTKAAADLLLTRPTLGADALALARDTCARCAERCQEEAAESGPGPCADACRACAAACRTLVERSLV